MSLITRCPACGTMFKVVPDQLRISQGWVRCGHCAEVFDATAYLQEREGASAQAPAAPIEEPAAVFAEPAQEFRAEPEPAPDDVPPSGPQSIDPFAEATSAPLPPPVEPAPVFTEADLDSVSFVRQARRKAFWRGPAVRALLAGVALVLGVLLAIQYAVHDRDRLAVAEPSLKPLLELLCEPLGCQVGPPRQIEAIVVDASSFNKLRGDAYRLNFTLKNLSAMEVAIPAVELTLTDTQDQAVVRRVLQPREMGASTAVIAPASEWSGSLALSVAPGSNTARIAGYRLLAFYP